MKIKSFILSVLIFANTVGNAQSFAVLHNFTDTSGSYPFGALLSDGGWFYGTTTGGGHAGGYGTVYKIKPDGSSYSSIYSFNGGSDGNMPGASLITDGLWLYGVTQYGLGSGSGDGGVFKLAKNGQVLIHMHAFNFTDGAWPIGALISDSTYLYGTTQAGGVNLRGSVFKINLTTYNYSNIANFDGPHGNGSGCTPYSDGTYLYGTTENGGTGDSGVVFRLKPDGSNYSVLLNFAGPNGSKPSSNLISSGSWLYGLTAFGGPYHNGTIFKMDTSGANYTLLHNFNDTTGALPGSGALLYDGTWLYGEAAKGGLHGKGVLFKIKPDGSSYTVIYNFDGITGEQPYGTLTTDGTYLYGVTNIGGTFNRGVLFKIDKNYIAGIHTYNQQQINIYPNPAQNNFTVEVSNTEKQTLSIFDVTGKQVLSQTITVTTTIDASNLPQGVYNISITSSASVTNKRLVITK